MPFTILIASRSDSPKFLRAWGFFYFLDLKTHPQLRQCQLCFPFLPTNPSRTSGQAISQPIHPIKPLKVLRSCIIYSISSLPHLGQRFTYLAIILYSFLNCAIFLNLINIYDLSDCTDVIIF